MDDGGLAASVLAKLVGQGHCTLVERQRNGTVILLVDSGWVDVTEQEAAFIDALHHRVDHAMDAQPAS